MLTHNLNRYLVLALLIFSIQQATGQQSDVTSLSPGIRFGMSPDQLTSILPGPGVSKNSSRSYTAFLERTTRDAESGNPLVYDFMFKRSDTKSPWRLERFYLRTDRDEDRDTQIVHWFNVVTKLYGPPRKTDDHGSGLGVRSNPLSYFFCTESHQAVVELKRIQNMSYLIFEPSTRQSKIQCTAEAAASTQTGPTQDSERAPSVATAQKSEPAFYLLTQSNRRSGENFYTYVDPKSVRKYSDGTISARLINIRKAVGSTRASVTDITYVADCKDGRIKGVAFASYADTDPIEQQKPMDDTYTAVKHDHWFLSFVCAFPRLTKENYVISIDESSLDYASVPRRVFDQFPSNVLWFNRKYSQLMEAKN